MKTKEIKIIILEFENLSELTPEDQVLVKAAREIANDAYAPYSKFKVGASILLENGKIISGNNQENAASPSGLCAERVALFYANSQFPDSKVKTIAISAINGSKPTTKAISPCGACRQVLVETENRYQHPIKIILDGSRKIHVLNSTNDLLPLSFSSLDLKSI
ncbi:cytidine deaminase [Sunxiuqinia sp. A32]|uniref:cytidine deaminase n=1 Tax=Sunxiuqinia sp. A32 TaxID=3461496 RepID=UPI004045F11E